MAHRLHGEHVAYGLLVQLFARMPPRRDDSRHGTVLLYGAPSGGIGRHGYARANRNDLFAIATANLASPHPPNTMVTLDLATMVQALRRVEALVAQV